MLAVGDSIMWGQGLAANEKFSTLVRDWLAAELQPYGRSVVLRSLARSGAVIVSDEPGAAQEDQASIGNNWGLKVFGEVPSDFPTIRMQVEQATMLYAADGVIPNNVDLILLDGGINDTQLTRFLSAGSDADVRALVQQYCVGRMRDLLVLTAQRFPTAKILVTNYFPMISRESDVKEVGWLFYLLGLLPTVVAAGTFLGPLDADPLLAAAIQAVFGVTLRNDAADRAAAFHDESTKGFSAVVNDVNRALGTTRVYLVDVGFGTEHAYGAPNTLVWRMFDNDPAYTQRAVACDAQHLSDMPPKFKHSLCIRAQMGHPNREGARRYADAIIRTLSNLTWEWKGLKLLSLCVDPLPSVEPGVTSTTTVFAWDRATGAPVAGSVNIGPDQFQLNKPFAYAFCTATPAIGSTAEANGCYQLEIGAPGYAPTWLDPRIGHQP